MIEFVKFIANWKHMVALLCTIVVCVILKMNDIWGGAIVFICLVIAIYLINTMWLLLVGAANRRSSTNGKQPSPPNIQEPTAATPEQD